jgi:hypothetical protein
MSAACPLSPLAWLVPIFGLLAMGGVIVALVLALRPGKDKGVGVCGGCLILLVALLALGVLGVGCTALTVIGLGAAAIEEGPVRVVELDWGEAYRTPDEPYPVHLRIEIEGRVDPARVTRWVRQRIEGDYTLSIDVREGPDGTRTVLDFGLPVEQEDLEELEADLREELPELELPRGLRIEARER